MKHVTRKLFKSTASGEWLVTSKGNSVRIFYGLRGTTNVAPECVFPDLLPRLLVKSNGELNSFYLCRGRLLSKRDTKLRRDYAETKTDL